MEVGIHLALLDDLLQSAQLVALAHGLDAEADVGISDRLHETGKGIAGQSHGLLTGDFPRAAAVDDDGIRSQKLGRPDGLLNVADAVITLFLLYGGQGNEVGGVEGHEDAVLVSLLADGEERALTGHDAFSCLVLVGVEALALQPARGLDGGLTALAFEPRSVAAGAEGGGGDGFEVDHMCSFPAVDRGIPPKGICFIYYCNRFGGILQGVTENLWGMGGIFKFGFIGGLTVPLPSPAEKGDREAVDEESG